jgi:hypothetical protein
MPGYGQWLRYTIVVTAAAALGAGTMAVGAASAAPPEGTVRGTDAPGAIPNRYIVVFKSGTDSARGVAATATSVAGRVGGEVRETYGTAVRGFSARLN